MEMYLAAPIFTPDQQAEVELLRSTMLMYGNVFSPLHASRDIWKGRAPKDCSPEERAQVLEGNIAHLECDVVVAWVGGMGGFTDPGVVWELGYATALNRTGLNSSPLIVAYISPSDERQSMNLMIAGTVNVVAKGIPDLSRCLQLLYTEEYEVAFEEFHPDKLLAQEREPIV